MLTGRECRVEGEGKSGVAVDCTARRNGASGGDARVGEVQTDEMTHMHRQSMNMIKPDRENQNTV